MERSASWTGTAPTLKIVALTGRERVDEDAVRDETGRFLIRPARHQIYVPEEKESRWDAMCQPGSFGYETGKIEIYGSLVTKEDRDSVVGWLTADDVIKRIEAEDRRTR